MSHYYLAEIFFPSLAAVAMLIYHLHYYYLVKQVPMQDCHRYYQIFAGLVGGNGHGTKTGYPGSANVT